MWGNKAKDYFKRYDKEQLSEKTVTSGKAIITHFLDYYKRNPGPMGRYYVENYIEATQEDKEPSTRNKVIGVIGRFVNSNLPVSSQFKLQREKVDEKEP